jgi:HPr kinase/phosphorylase
MLPDAAPLTVHASAVAHDGRAVLILGASGAGKSGLALQMMALGARLVADDRVVLRRRAGGGLTATAPAALAGLIEARGIGLLRAPALPEAEVVLAVDLDRDPEARMPQSRSICYLDSTVRLISGRDIPNLGFILTLFLQGTAALPD